MSDEGAGIAFARKDNGANLASGLFSHSNGGLGVAAREDIVFLTGGGSGIQQTEEALRINSTGTVSIPSTGNLNVAGNITGTAATFTGNVTVGGTLTYDDVTFLDSVGVATARSGLDECAGSITPVISLQAATTTLTTTSASNIDTFVAATFRSAQYQIQITQGSSYHVTTLNVLHDGSSVYLSEFGTIRTGAILATFDADINS